MTSMSLNMLTSTDFASLAELSLTRELFLDPPQARFLRQGLRRPLSWALVARCSILARLLCCGCRCHDCPKSARGFSLSLQASATALNAPPVERRTEKHGASESRNVGRAAG